MRYVSFKLIKNEYKNAENMIYFDTSVNIFQVIIYGNILVLCNILV